MLQVSKHVILLNIFSLLHGKVKARSKGSLMNYSKPSVISAWYLGVLNTLSYQAALYPWVLNIWFFQKKNPKLVVCHQRLFKLPISSARAAHRFTTQQEPSPSLFPLTMAQLIAFVCVPYLLQALLCLCGVCNAYHGALPPMDHTVCQTEWSPPLLHIQQPLSRCATQLVSLALNSSSQ